MQRKCRVLPFCYLSYNDANMVTCPSCLEETEVKHGLCQVCGEEIHQSQEEESEMDSFDEDEDDLIFDEEVID